MLVLRVLAGLVALALFVAYFAPVALKLKQLPLFIVLAAGLVLVLVDLYESLRER